MVTLTVVTLLGCNKEDGASPTTLPSTTSSTASTDHFNPNSLLNDMVAAYNAYITQSDVDYPITSIIFDDGSDCYIVTEEQLVYAFFREGASDSAKLYESMKFILYYAPDFGDVMLLAMQNAWNAYAAECAANHKSIYDIQLYIFECSFFEGVFAIDANNRIQKDLVREGNHCGTFGAFTIYVPENADQAQQGSMTDGEIKTLIKNAYSKFVIQTVLDNNTSEAIEYYVFELNGQFYRYGDPLERLDSSAVTELAMDSIFDGWRVYLPVLSDVMPQHDIFLAAYQAFIQESTENNKKYGKITAYAFAYQDAYYAVDEWNNVLKLDDSQIGKAASETDFDGIAIYKMK